MIGKEGNMKNTRISRIFFCKKLDRKKLGNKLSLGGIVGTTQEHCMDFMGPSLKKKLEWMFKFQWN
jgi:hypothetical protein